MKLYIFRHAIAEEHGGSGDDADRALTESGRAKMVRGTTGLRKLKVAPPLILSSPLRRARETAEILAEGLGGTIEEMAELAPGFDPPAVLKAIGRFAAHDSVAIVGHQPGLGRLAAFMLTGSERGGTLDFKKGGVACFEFEPDSIGSGCSLQWMLTPRVLRAL